MKNRYCFSSRQRNESGMTTVSYMLATGLSLIVLTWCTTFILASYTRAAVRGASERATRAGVVEYTVSRDTTRALLQCRNTFEDDLGQAIPGEISNGISYVCEFDGNLLRVNTQGDLSTLGPMLVGARFNESTVRPIEDTP